MPAPIFFSHQLLQKLEQAKLQGEIAYLRPDSKSQVSVQYKNGRPERITTVVLSHQTDDVAPERIRKDLIAKACEVLEPTGLLTPQTSFYINPTGSFIQGGPYADAGVTGRKIIVDTYGGVGSHGGGAFSGKDPSKVDRSAAYYCRYAAKNIVAAGLAEKCEIQVGYAIGVARPLSINISTYGTGIVSEEKLQHILEDERIFDFRPAALIDELGLMHPDGWCYQDTAAYGHFGDEAYPWERTDKAQILRESAGVRSAA
jgi:S-adenosylmethionine synthetase